MSRKSELSFVTLPVELVHRILDRLDGKDILLSFGNVCRRFRTIAYNYGRLSINLTDRSSKTEIEWMCQVMRPENVVSVTLKNSSSNSETIWHFLCFAYTNKLIRLRSLTLWDMQENDFQIMINPLVRTSILASFSLKVSETKPFSNDSLDLLSALIALPSLRQLNLDGENRIIRQISWPNQCTLQELRLRTCTFEQFCNILDQSPNLRIITLNHGDMEGIDHPVVGRTPYRQLTSLTLDDIQMPISELELLLSLLPSLVYFELTSKLIRSFHFLQCFSQWESFLGERLPLLKKFNFCIYTSSSNNVNLESILAPFCTSFWLEEKRWFVTAEYNQGDSIPTVTLYSSTYSTEKFPENPRYGTISYSTMTTRSDNISKTSKPWSTRINLSWMITSNLADQNPFRNMNKLALDITDHWPSGSLERLSMLMNFSQLNEIWLFEHHACILQSGTIKILLEHVSNARTLGISPYDDFVSRIENIGSVVSRRIDHLIIQVREVYCIKLALKCIERVSSITFKQKGSSSNSIPDMIQWLKRKRKKFSVDDECKYVQIWLDDDDSELSEVKSNHKRIKLTHHQDAS